MSIALKLPVKVRDFWLKVYDEASTRYNHTLAERIATKITMDRVNVIGQEAFARSKDFKTTSSITYKFDIKSDSIERSEGGMVVREAVLATTDVVENIALDQAALKMMAKQINEEGLIGRIDPDARHQKLKELRSQGLSEEDIEKELQSLDTGIVARDAYVKNDKLFSKIYIKPEVYDEAKDFHSVSIEARFPTIANRAGVVSQARASGFVFTNEPADSKATILHS